MTFCFDLETHEGIWEPNIFHRLPRDVQPLARCEKKRCTDNIEVECVRYKLCLLGLFLRKSPQHNSSPQKTHFQWLAASYINLCSEEFMHIDSQGDQPPLRNSGIFVFLSHKRGTPWKVNGWNLQPSPI